MFYKGYLNKCNRYMYLECTKKELKETFKLPKVIDYPIARAELLKLLGATKEDLNKEYVYGNYCTKVDLIKDDNYYMFNFSKTFVNDIKILKMSFDKTILRLNNININKFIFVNIDGNFKKDGNIDFNDFFKMNDVTELVSDFDFKRLEEDIKVEPKNVFNVGCKKCPYVKYCIKDICDYEESIFSLRGKIDNLLEENIYKISDIDKNLLDEYQKRQVEMDEYIDKENILSILNQIKYPINFIDFEKANLIIPIADGGKCNQGLFFQYSLDVLDDKNSNLKHFECMIEDSKELNILAKTLNENLSNGSLVCYDIATEKTAIKTLSKLFPEYENLKISDDRYVDLSLIFKNMYYYNKRMLGSSSIKYVLPALTNISYDDLGGVENGIEAASSFVSIRYSSEEEKEKLKKEMLEYCGLDTKAMYYIYLKLFEILEK